jgi:hypothetical protein
MAAAAAASLGLEPGPPIPEAAGFLPPVAGGDSGGEVRRGHPVVAGANGKVGGEVVEGSRSWPKIVWGLLIFNEIKAWVLRSHCPYILIFFILRVVFSRIIICKGWLTEVLHENTIISADVWTVGIDPLSGKNPLPPLQGLSSTMSKKRASLSLTSRQNEL